ncbi:MAG TPA: hypothetical protein VFV94_13570 [Polyangiaceae bacterium]|nr:hypothetical protein [Polyangiaceae bacterium]
MPRSQGRDETVTKSFPFDEPVTQSYAVVDEASLRARIAVARGAPPLDLPTALALVRDRHRLDLSQARARAGFTRGHLLDIVLALPGGRNTPDEELAAGELVELLLGEARRDDWIHSVTSLAAPRGGLLKIVQAAPDEGRFFPLSELEATVTAAIQGIHAGLPSEPLWKLGGEQRWYLFELDVEPLPAYPEQADVALVSTFLPELVKCFLSGGPFASTRFSRAGELFGYLKYESRERDPRRALAQRRVLEDALDAALVSERAGRVIGSGMGVVHSYVDFALSSVERAVKAVRSVAGRVGLGPRTWIQFFDAPLENEWLGARSDTPPPPLRSRAARFGALAILAGLSAWPLPAQAQPDMHGPVDPCTVAFVADNLTTCEACPAPHGDFAACEAAFAPRGFVRKCRSGPHSPPSEVWCSVPPLPKLERGPKPFVILSIVAAVAILLLAASTFWKRRKRA